MLCLDRRSPKPKPHTRRVENFDKCIGVRDPKTGEIRPYRHDPAKGRRCQYSYQGDAFAKAEEAVDMIKKISPERDPKPDVFSYDENAHCPRVSILDENGKRIFADVQENRKGKPIALHFTGIEVDRFQTESRLFRRFGGETWVCLANWYESLDGTQLGKKNLINVPVRSPVDSEKKPEVKVGC